MAETLKDHSRQNWSVPNDLNTYPGDDNVQLGCLQRIADSLEKMEKPFADLISENKRLKEDREWLRTRRAKLEKQVAAYKGIVNRLKKRG